MDRSSEEAFFESIDRMKQQASKHQKAKNEAADMDPGYEQQELFDFLEEEEEDKEEASSLDELLEEAEEWKERCEQKLKAGLSENQKKELHQAVKALEKAVAFKDKKQLNDAIEEATDIFIEIDLEL